MTSPEAIFEDIAIRKPTLEESRKIIEKINELLEERSKGMETE